MQAYEDIDENPMRKIYSFQSRFFKCIVLKTALISLGVLSFINTHISLHNEK